MNPILATFFYWTGNGHSDDFTALGFVLCAVPLWIIALRRRAK